MSAVGLPAMQRSVYRAGCRRALARRCWAPCAAAVLALFVSGCGASNSQVAKSARRVAVAHIADLAPEERATALATLPVILEIREGDRFPVEVLFDSRLLALHTDGTWTVEARETFYVLLREEGAPAVSVDGVDFDRPVQGSFGVGVDSQKEQPAKLRVMLRWHAAGAGQAP